MPVLETDEDIQRFAQKLMKAGREGVAWEIRKLQWILEEKEKQPAGGKAD